MLYDLATLLHLVMPDVTVGHVCVFSFPAFADNNNNHRHWGKKLETKKNIVASFPVH